MPLTASVPHDLLSGKKRLTNLSVRLAAHGHKTAMIGLIEGTEETGDSTETEAADSTVAIVKTEATGEEISATEMNRAHSATAGTTTAREAANQGVSERNLPSPSAGITSSYWSLATWQRGYSVLTRTGNPEPQNQ